MLKSRNSFISECKNIIKEIVRENCDTRANSKYEFWRLKIRKIKTKCDNTFVDSNSGNAYQGELDKSSNNDS